MNFKKVSNQIMLITYADSMGKNLKELEEILTTQVKGAIGGLHILPFFPSSADRGFAPMTYREVDPAFGDWEDIERLASKYYLMYDYMINHVSAHSPEYLDYLEKKDESEYRDFFIRFQDFWENGYPTQEQLEKIYKRKDGGPSVKAEFADGSSELIWSTFSSEQIDLDCSPPKILWAIAVEEAGRPPNTTAAREATLKEMDTGTPITRQRIKIKNKINPAFMSCFPLSFRILQSAVPA